LISNVSISISNVSISNVSISNVWLFVDPYTKCTIQILHKVSSWTDRIRIPCFGFEETLVSPLPLLLHLGFRGDPIDRDVERAPKTSERDQLTDCVEDVRDQLTDCVEDVRDHLRFISRTV
jgi:hypothetical protein